MKNTKDLLLPAMKNAFNELLKVMNRNIDMDEVDPEKMKISASAYRLAMEDAIAIDAEIQRLEASDGEDTPEKAFFNVETKIPNGLHK